MPTNYSVEPAMCGVVHFGTDGLVVHFDSGLDRAAADMLVRHSKSRCVLPRTILPMLGLYWD